ncbi:serine/threonine-protein kinase [Anabaena subtropica]|uniref:Serine/threonine protein kinase n=1 Tax=Anabaena subtropica FACHB-260 TaxID=2692884 RepID=A0ABR8CJQ1_9NOST|nr:serine/threonine-protein kinase [Anabaena subtropica]MBD2343457.1 serine/threonine protein kinase [Anabaena subtropica FACHB-260]
MTCCLNPACHNPPHPDGVKFCSSCGVPLIVLRNRYRPMKTLGGGGFGKTYLAEDVDKLNEHCVIKQFAPQVQGTASLNKATELFEQEAKRLQQLGKHPQIPTLLAYFNEDNRLYLVQEFMAGQNLFKELQQQGIFNEQKVRELLLDLLDILQTVHQQQVIHRDIKPENIIRHSDGKLVLIDFGASKQLTATVMTNPGTAIGSFGYAPLEQMQGGEAYPVSDLYSVGATCFHLLSGIHPWELWKRQGYGWVANWRQHLPQPVSQELGRILDKLLHEEHQQRYHSATEVLQALNSSPSLPVPPTQPVIVKPVSPPPSPVPPTQPAIVKPSSPPPSTRISSSQPIPAPTPPPKHLNKQALWGFIILCGGLTGFWFWQSSLSGYKDSPLPTQTLEATPKLSNSPQPSFTPVSISDIAPVKTLQGHSDVVFSVAISPDGKTFASGSKDKTIKLWNLTTGEQIRNLAGHSGGVGPVAISPDGKTLASGSGDKTIKLWNLATGQQIRTLTGHSSEVNSLAISPDGKTLASGSSDTTIKLWNLATGQQIRTLTGHSERVLSVAISPDGKTLASGSRNTTIKLWNLTTGQELRSLTGDSWAYSLVISPDGKTLVSGHFDSNTITLWNLETGEKIHTLKGHSNLVLSVAISPDGKTLASGSGDDTIKLWNMATGEQIRTLKGHSHLVNSVAFSPDGKNLVSGSFDNTMKIWRLE